MPLSNFNISKFTQQMFKGLEVDKYGIQNMGTKSEISLH